MRASVSANFAKKLDSYIPCEIPDAREPEFGFLLEDMTDHRTIYESLASRSDIKILSHDVPEERFLISLAEDTVDENGHPLRQIGNMGLERRRRVNFIPGNQELSRYDISFKDATKSTMRREWEANAYCLRSGEAEIIQKLSRDIPESSILNPDNNRISSICIASRASYQIVHTLKEVDAVVAYEICNDACVLTNPHADRILGYRKEVELEAKEIRVASSRDMHADNLNDVLDLSIEILQTHLNQAAFKGLVAPSSISKVSHANELVQLDYERSMPKTDLSHGLDWALVQNVRAWDFTFPNPREAIERLTRTLPLPHLLTPTAKADFGQYFPDANKYPLFPQPRI